MNIIISILDPCDYSEYFINFSTQNHANTITRTEYLYFDIVEQIELSFWMIQDKNNFPKEQLCSIMIMGNISWIIPSYQIKPRFSLHWELFRIDFWIDDINSELPTNQIFSCNSMDFCVDVLNKKIISIAWPYRYLESFLLKHLEWISVDIN